MIDVHIFLNVKMNSGPNLDIHLFSYGETPDHGRWMLMQVDGTPVDLAEVHVSERNSRRSELKAALDAYFGFSINLHDLAAPPDLGALGAEVWPNTWSRP